MIDGILIKTRPKIKIMTADLVIYQLEKGL